MRRIILVGTVMALIFTVAADTASAQLLFKKIKQRRREELRAEIHARLSDELSTKMETDMAREMKIATDTIKAATEAKDECEHLRDWSCDGEVPIRHIPKLITYPEYHTSLVGRRKHTGCSAFISGFLVNRRFKRVGNHQQKLFIRLIDRRLII